MKHILLLILLMPILASAQVFSNKEVGKKNEELVDSIKKTEYPYLLPIWGNKLHKAGFTLPLSAGISVQYVWQRSENKHMKSLYKSADNNELIERINALSVTSKGNWGKMSVLQMVVHVQKPFEVAYGELKIKRGLMGLLFGGMVKKKLMKEEPFKKNLPTVKEFIMKGDFDFETEKQKLIALVKKMGMGPQVLTKDPHPFFGKLSNTEWDALLIKHMDHHLTQFGV